MNPDTLRLLKALTKQAGNYSECGLGTTVGCTTRGLRAQVDYVCWLKPLQPKIIVISRKRRVPSFRSALIMSRSCLIHSSGNGSIPNAPCAIRFFRNWHWMPARASSARTDLISEPSREENNIFIMGCEHIRAKSPGINSGNYGGRFREFPRFGIYPTLQVF